MIALSEFFFSKRICPFSNAFFLEMKFLCVVVHPIPQVHLVVNLSMLFFFECAQL